MNEERNEVQRRDAKRRGRLIAQVDKMVRSGRLTEVEAKRLRVASNPDEFDRAVGDVRMRHAEARLHSAVAAGALTQEEADGFAEALRSGEHPRSLRVRLAKYRPGTGSQHERRKCEEPPVFGCQDGP